MSTHATHAPRAGARSGAGILPSGIPYNRFGSGPRPVVVFQGLEFENRPMTGLELMYARRLYRFLERDRTVWVLHRRRGLPRGFSLADMADDYAAAIRDDLRATPADVIGLSTGGSIALYFAADHPDLVHRLVIHSSAHTLAPESRALQMEIARRASRRRWSEVYCLLFGTLGPRRLMRLAARPAGWLMARSAPDDPSDLIVTVEAEDVHAFRDRLGEIRVPTLVAGGSADFFYTEALYRETAEGIPGARLALYPGMGHPASGARFARDVLEFLDGG